jgi:hypothetical protein
MNETFDQYQKRNVPNPATMTAQTSGSAMEAIANSGWAIPGQVLPWPRKDLAKGGRGSGRSRGMRAKSGRSHFKKKTH